MSERLVLELTPPTANFIILNAQFHVINTEFVSFLVLIYHRYVKLRVPIDHEL